MRRDDLLHILCRLTHGYYDFENEQSSVPYEFSERKYEITLKMIKQKLVSFSIECIGDVVNEKA